MRRAGIQSPTDLRDAVGGAPSAWRSTAVCSELRPGTNGAALQEGGAPL